MTTLQIAKLFKARRAGRGKWLARCPIHGRDRTPSLEIKEGKRLGVTIVGCYAGCDKLSVLEAVGLKLQDLFADTIPDREALRLAERIRSEGERRRSEARQKERVSCDLARKWEAVRNSLGLLLLQQPDDSKLASLFNHACDRSRNVPSTGYCETGLDIGMFPPLMPLAGITAQDVGRQIAKYLRLEAS